MTELGRQARDQAAHFVAAIVAVAIVSLPHAGAFAGALMGLALGFVREFTQHGRVPRGGGSWLDMLFWTLGGAAAGWLLS